MSVKLQRSLMRALQCCAVARALYINSWLRGTALACCAVYGLRRVETCWTIGQPKQPSTSGKHRRVDYRPLYLPATRYSA